MNHQNQKVASCITYITQPRNSDDKTCNTSCNSNATISLKALAIKALQCNTLCNFDATQSKNQCNFEPKKVDEKLHRNITQKYGISVEKIQNFLGEDWELYKDNAKALIGWADLLSERQQMERGEIPKDFTAITHCASCGDVFVPPAIANNGSVQGCPWCLNESKRLSIPHPITNNQQLE